MTGAQAQEYYGGMENNYENHYGKDTYKSKDSNSSVNVKKIKCNNVNVNVNGLELNGLPPFLTGLVSEAQTADEGQTGASSYGSGKTSYGSDGQSGSDNDFRFICINNNNNTVVVGEEPPTPPVGECAEDIATCFEELLGVGLGFDQFLRGLERGIDVEINGVEVTFNSFEGMCSALEDVPSGQLEDVLEEIITDATGGFPPLTIEFLTCVAVAVGLPLPH
jgi:hypothetical protein